MAFALEEALAFEAREAADEISNLFSIEEMMGSMLENVEEGGGYVRQDLDDYQIRKMLLARHYMQEDVKKMEEMKKAIIQDWDARIAKKKKDIQNIESIVDHYIKTEKDKKTLSLDIATASVKRYPHKVQVENEDKVKEYLAKQNLLDKFLKEPVLDKTAVQKYFEEKFQKHVESLANEAIEKEKEELGRVTKKREKEIIIEITDRELPKFNETLPEGFALKMPEEKVTIRSNIKK